MHCNGILLSCKRNEILPFITLWMGREGITLSKISQTEKDKHDNTYTWTLKKKKK